MRQPTGVQTAAGLWPMLVYLVLSALFLGTAAYMSAAAVITEQPYKDIWQHVAALRALMENPTAPGNPFVSSDDPSRHFHPLWVGFALLGRALGLTVWQVVTWASFGGMLVLGVGIYAFACAYFRKPWAPVILLAVLLFGWAFQVQHTGLHSFATLLYGAAYPATFMVGFALILWAVVVTGLERQAWLWLLVPLAALGFATHQLGAVIAFVGAGAFVVAQPGVSFQARSLAALALLGGIGLSFFWPYYNPLMLMLRPGNASWVGGPDFYDWRNLILIATPAALGILGLRGSQARPLLLALLLYAVIFAVGLLGLKIASRFLMPMLLVLQIGLASLIGAAVARVTVRRGILTGIALVVVLALYAHGVRQQLALQARIAATAPRPYDAALALTGDIADTEEVAAFGMAAWPIAAGGQKVLSVSWPEPGIPDLAQRQAVTAALFDPALSLSDRQALAARHGVQVLIVDVRSLPADTLAALAAQAVRSRAESSLRRFDLFD